MLEPSPSTHIQAQDPLVGVVLAAQSSIAEGLVALRVAVGASRVWLARLTDTGRDVVLIEEACAAAVSPWWDASAEVRLPPMLVWEDGVPRAIALAGSGLVAWVVNAGSIGLVAMREQAEPWRPDEQGLLQGAVSVLAGEWARRRPHLAAATLEPVLGILPDPAVVTDLQRNIVWLNAAAEVAFGASLAQLRGHPLRQLYADEQGWQTMQQQVDAAQQSGWPGGAVEARCRRHSGETFTGEVIGGTLRDALGRPIGFVALVRDISARQQADTRRLRAERLAGLGTMAGGLAHDFNNLLTPVLANAVTLGQDLHDPEQQEMAQEIEVAARRAAQLSGQLLTYLGQTPMQPALQDLAVLVAAEHAALAATLSPDVRLEVRLSCANTVVDVALLRQVLWNLVTNAAEAMPPGLPGCIQVRVGMATLPASELCAGRRELSPGTYAVLEVTDDGEGMSEHALERLFDPFFTTRFSGRGLGMAVVQGVVRAHHGDVLVQSTRGTGSRVRVVLPASRALPTEPPAPSAAPLQGRQVLLVEDEPAVQHVLSRLLRREGMVVHLAPDGPSALEEAARLGAALELVLLDVSLPRLSGTVVLERLRARFPDVPIIVMSGHRPAELSARFSELGVAFLMKPFTVDDFTRTLHRLLP